MNATPTLCVCEYTNILKPYFHGGGTSGKFYFVFDTYTIYSLSTMYMHDIWSYLKSKFDQILRPVHCMKSVGSGTHCHF